MEILELKLLSNDLEGSTYFYHTLLEFPILERNERQVSFQAGSTKLTFIKSDEGITPFYHFAFNIPDNQLMQALDWIAARTEVLEVGLHQKIADFDNWDAKAFYFMDNQGSILEFIVRYELKQSSEVPFTGSSVLSVSEIGLVLEDVVRQSEEINQKYDIPFYSKQPRAEKFTVLGDDHGLLITVCKDRNWYPTTLKSRVFYTALTFKEKGNIQELIIE